MDNQQSQYPLTDLQSPAEVLSPLLSPEKQKLKQYYVQQARSVIAKIPAGYSDEKCLHLLKKQYKRLINLLTVLDRPWYRETEGIQQACLTYIIAENTTQANRQKTGEALAQWSSLLAELNRRQSFISRTLQNYHRQLRELEGLLSGPAAPFSE